MPDAHAMHTLFKKIESQLLLLLLLLLLRCISMCFKVDHHDAAHPHSLPTLQKLAALHSDA
jgi:hypothetical protein